MIKIIDNKKVELTADEVAVYEKICKSYDRPNFKGQMLFIDLFESDENGIITFIKPPTAYTSMEVVIFLMSIMQHQHLRIMYKEMDEKLAKMQKQVDEFTKKS